jgi:hypothetical protein
MRPLPYLAALLSVSSLALADGAFYGDPPDATHPWAIHDMNRPQPPVVDPGTFSSQEKTGTPPSDAIILFSGKESDLDKWQSDKKPAEPTKWIVKDGLLQCVPGSGYIQTKEEFADCQLHIEWSEPEDITGSSQGRGNSGVFLMGEVEVQVLDIYNNKTYPDGAAGAVYGINTPLPNPVTERGQSQTDDIIFRRPIFKDGKEVDPGYLTVLSNGVLVQDHTPLEGGGGHKKRSQAHPFPEVGPLKLQDHGNPVRFRNIWYRPLPKRAIDGGDTSVMSPEATAKKRAEIAASIREDAAKLEGKAKMLRLFESTYYQANDEALKSASAMVSQFATEAKDTPADKLESRKGEILEVSNALQYLITKAQVLPADFEAAKILLGIVKANEWDKKKK